MLQTEFAFTLPKGYVDERGNLHRHGTMQLATALDEIAPLQDARARSNDAYVIVLLLSRVVTQLGDISPVPPSIIERLFASDFIYLQDLYVKVNESGGESLVETACPVCGTHFMLDLAEAVES